MTIEEALKTSERYSEISEKIFGYVNGKKIKIIKEYIIENNLDDSHIIVGKKKKQKILISGNCEHCNKWHDGSYGSGRFCSKFCVKSFAANVNKEEVKRKISETWRRKDLGHKRELELTCSWCGNKFIVSWRKRNQKTCSRSCQASFRFSKVEEKRNYPIEQNY